MSKTRFLLLIILFAGTANGQETIAIKKQTKEPAEKYFYIRAGLGYAFPNAGQTDFNASLNTIRQPGSYGTVTSFSYKPTSLSSGLCGTIGGGYMITEHLGLELDANLGIANTKYTYADNYIDNGGISGTMNVTTYTKMPVFLLPSVVIQTGSDKLNVYARGGLALPVKNKIIVESQNSSPNSIVLQTQELTTRFRVGFSGAIGLSHTFGQYIQIWGEVSLLSFAPYLKEGVITNSSLNGVSNLAAMSQQDKVTKYEFTGTTSSTSFSTNDPTVEKTFSVPYSNIGIQLGVSFLIH